MADEVKKQEAAVEAKGKIKKVKPTNCAQSNKRIRRKDWYYRDGKYFANKQAHRLFVATNAEKALKAKEAAAAATVASSASTEKAAG